MTRPEWSDDDSAQWDKRSASLLLDRSRRDLLAKITKDSIEPFSYLYEEYDRMNDLETKLDLEEGRAPRVIGERIADNLIGWLDNILVLSASGGGWRATQVERVQKASNSDHDDPDSEFESTGRGLKHRA